MFTPVIFLATTLLMLPAWAANKCTGADGKVSYQDALCPGKGEKLDVRLALGAAHAAASPATASTSVTTSLPTAPTLPMQPTPVANASPLARQADDCLAWYKPRLRDPAGAYYTEPSKDGRVLSITIHATNGYGGYVTRRGSCEIYNGKLDNDWTKIHAKREGW